MKNVLKTIGFVAVLLTMLVITIYGASATFGGSGTPEDPYQITNCIQLQNISINTSANYKIMNDINCSDTINWNSGMGFGTIASFNGVLDGNGKIVTGFFSNATHL